MTTCEKKVALLKDFGIPAGEGERVENVRAVLARLLAARSLRLADLQTVRDILERKEKTKEPEAWLFVAALFVADNGGNAFLREGKAVKCLQAGGHLEDPSGLGFAETNDAFDRTVEAVCAGFPAASWKEGLAGDVLVHPDTDRWFFQRNKAAVDELNATFGEFAVVKNLEEDVPADRLKDILDRAKTFTGFSLNEAQTDAIAAAAVQRFTVITGGPGTGKTTSVCAILRALLALHPDWTEKDIALAAPTGRAAQRMQEAVLAQCAAIPEDEPLFGMAAKLEGSTVHNLLGGYAPNWRHDADHPLEKKVVIVDETSMVDLYLMQALLKALKADTRLILLGDADQLPSVDTGAVLGDLTQIGLGHGENALIVRKLEVCERAKGEVYDVSKQINESAEGLDAAQAVVASWATGKKIEAADLVRDAAAIPDGESEFRWLEPTQNIKKADILALYARWMKNGKLAALAAEMPRDGASLGGTESDASKALFAELNSRRILTLVREGWYGVKEANAFLLKEAKAAADRKYADYLAFPGVPIMVTKNTPERGLFNGDVGVTVRGPNGMVVLFPRGKKTIACPVALLPEHELAYAMTVHKSQGSEFKQVLVVLPDDDQHPLLNRQIVYTGITRAKKRAVIMGSRSSLETALARKLERNTGIVISPVRRAPFQ